MIFLSSFLKSKPLSETHPNSLAKFSLPNVIPHHIEFTGKVYEFNFINLDYSPHFHYTDLKTYNYFKEYFKLFNKFENVEIENSLSQEVISNIFKYVQREKHYKKLNLVICDYNDFYLKMGNQFVSNEFMDFFKSQNIHVSIIGEVPPFIKMFLENKGESHSNSFYFNNMPFDNCFNKFEELKSLLESSQILKPHFNLYDDSQSENKKEIFVGDLVFTKNEEFWRIHSDFAPFVPAYPHKRYEMNGQFDYYHVLGKTEDSLIVLNFNTKKIGIVKSEKLHFFSKAKIHFYS